MSELFIPVLQGTTREKRQSIHVARLVQKQLEKRESIKTQLVDPLEFNFPGDGNDDPEGKDPRYTEISRKADAFVVVVPEYNHSFPGSLKRMLDSELRNYLHKPVAFAGVSAGVLGGARAIESLVNVVRELGMVASSVDVLIPKVQTLFDDEGNLLDDSYLKRIDKAIDELIWLANSLKDGVAKHPNRFHQST